MYKYTYSDLTWQKPIQGQNRDVNSGMSAVFQLSLSLFKLQPLSKDSWKHNENIGNINWTLSEIRRQWWMWWTALWWLPLNIDLDTFIGKTARVCEITSLIITYAVSEREIPWLPHTLLAFVLKSADAHTFVWLCRPQMSLKGERNIFHMSLPRQACYHALPQLYFIW